MVVNCPISPQVQVVDQRDIDPNVKQWRASDPLYNVWVSASAGTGKTKVLSDRVLRLLLPRHNGQGATPPHRILCLTYTKAAASEMTLRINERLAQWVIMSDEALAESLKKTTGSMPDEKMLRAARQLFARVVDTPGGLKIMTIHAFCQSILGRFPLEAGILPQIEILDDGMARELLRQSVLDVVKGDQEGAERFSRLVIELGEAALFDRLKDCLGQRDQMEDFFQRHTNIADQEAALRAAFDAPAVSEDELCRQVISSFDRTEFMDFAQAMAQGLKTDQAHSEKLYHWLSLSEAEKIAAVDDMTQVFLTKEKTPRKLSAHMKATFPNAEGFHDDISMTLIALADQIAAIKQVYLTLDILNIAHAVESHFMQQKRAQGMLDYNDLILTTYRLLTYAKKAVPWVLYKLDGGIDHILLDEAQDTNPIQWDIIKLFADEFFQNPQEGALRTLFVVGDEKQSIYRFQGAALEDFQFMRTYFALQAATYGAPWHDESLTISFRSTRSVLGFVDAAFASPRMQNDIGVQDGDVLQHISFRRRQEGRVTLWPLIPYEKKEKPDVWELPINIKERMSSRARLADKIAQQIKQWISEGRPLISKGRSIEPGDIMVLVRSRNEFVEHLIRALKAQFIPVSGADRLVLNEHIAVKDLLSLAKFALQSRDDLALAEILKSPFIGWDDETLEQVAHGRTGTLWQSLRASQHGDVIDWLEAIQGRVNDAPFEFFFDVINHPCPADERSGLRALQARLGGDCLDVVDEFLIAVQTYQLQQSRLLQSFMVWQTQNPIEIKREFEGQENAVRIMTVHGAKGLQAPIVFLPDTLRGSSAIQKNVPRLIFPRRSGADVPMWSPRKEVDSKNYIKIHDKIAAQENAEYKRLFYVAATRAEDELIICGAEGGHKGHEDSWYYYAQNGFEALGDAVEQEDECLIYRHLQDPSADSEASKVYHAQQNVAPLPEWVFRNAPEEPLPPRPLRPSRPSEEEPSVLSPRQQDGHRRYRRGLLTHTLLQFLPAIADDKRAQVGKLYLDRQAKDLEESVREDILREVLTLMRESAFADIFGPNSQAEVAVSGLLPSGRLISGQIDRLVVRGDEVLIIDYKTNRPQPAAPSDVPPVYMAQMRAYKEALMKIYPDKQIRAALLWTYGAVLMELPDL